MIGFSSWLMLPIRANANTAINENDPSSARELLAYYNREQYGDANVFYDKYYSYQYRREQDRNNPTKDDKPKYEKKNGKYVIVNTYKDVLPNYSGKHKGFIPRMTSTSQTSIDVYKAITGIPQKSNRRPTFGENLHFMLDYQFGYMYGRYFMWNFVGRQNDTQGQLDKFNGNWLSGIPFVDNARLGPQEGLPDDIKDNKGRNTYYFLPLILGLLGLFYQIRWDKENFYTLFIFFVFTGFAIIFYTNPKPFEPRERDYAVVGSFYIFAIWIGFGVYALYTYLKSVANKKMVATAVSLVSLLAVPFLMGYQNWDDHDRSNRYTTRLNAQAYLESCDPNAIMFTIGDNDTFPLWYMQEVEGIRTDIKLVNTSLFATDWYIDQMKRATYESAPIPSQLEHDQYRWGTLDVAYYFPELYPQYKDSIFDINMYMRWIESNNPRTFYDLDEDGNPEKMLPTDRIRIPVNKENALKSGIVAAKDADKIVDYIDIKINNSLFKNRILMLDILANFDWKQPIYFTGGSYADEEYIWLKDYLQLDGMSYKLVPIKTSMKGRSMFDLGRIDPEKMYANIQKLDWRNINDGKIYLDEQTKKNAISLRNNLMRLSEAFAKEGDTAKAIEILDLSLEKMPIKDFGHFSLSLGYPEMYYRLGETEKAREAANTLFTIFDQQMTWLMSFPQEKIEWTIEEIRNNLFVIENIQDQIKSFDADSEIYKKVSTRFLNIREELGLVEPYQ